jgi:hypothetical protein
MCRGERSNGIYLGSPPITTISSKGNNFMLPSIYSIIQAVIHCMVIGAAIYLFINASQKVRSTA